ncbi:MAG: hypothetical protein WCF95_00805 [bacterium]
MLNVGINNPNFKSNPINNVHLRNSQGGYVKAVFAELDKKNPKDVEGIKSISNLWKHAKYITTYCNKFLIPDLEENARYFSLELMGNGETLAEKTIGLLKLKFENLVHMKTMHISVLQAKPDIMFKDVNQTRPIKGIGEVLMGETFKLAGNKGFGKIEISSTNDDFYYRSFKNANLSLYQEEKFYNNFDIIEVYKQNFDKYINYINKKYNPEK